MAVKEELPLQNDELILKQVNDIIEEFKSIKKIYRSKLEDIEKKYGFTPSQLGVIFYLYERPSITLNELSDHMMLTKSTVSGIVDRLTNQGVVNREIPEDNRRTVKLSISEAFKKNNDIDSMKRFGISDLIYKGIKRIGTEEVEKIIYGLRQLSLLLRDNNWE